MTEFEIIARYFTRPARTAVLGVGDDCALVRARKGMVLALSTDILLAGRHFLPDADPEGLGHKSLAVNLSDLAAMGAEPRWALLAIALPKADEETEPSFEHFDATNLPVIEDGGLWARIVAGTAFGRTSPVAMRSPWLYAEIVLAEGASAPFDPDAEERGIYVVEGEVEIAGEIFAGPRLLVFRPGDRITARAKSRARLMFLGGTAMEGPRYIWWNFVSSRKERIEQAKDEWKTGRFRAVPGETEFIPLPEL